MLSLICVRIRVFFMLWQRSGAFLSHTGYSSSNVMGVALDRQGVIDDPTQQLSVIVDSVPMVQINASEIPITAP